MGYVAGDTEVASGGMIAMLPMLMIMLGMVSVVSYVFYSLGLYGVAHRRGIRNSWLVWVPVGCLWILGSVSDRYQYVAKGKNKSRRKVMLALSIAAIVLCFVRLFGTFLSVLLGNLFGRAALAGVGLVMILVLLAIIGVVIALVVCQYMCLCDLYHSCTPDHGAVFLVLSIMFSYAMPFFVFACRNKDMGMWPIRNPYAQ